ncbi:ComEA family DNA-binding protein [Roseiconus lacunae]|uniref:Helix-hairpin-helix domain-containing protein n=1 Tax=Roseiconus lacunae TaxID=2605694 RepID=A0ABT7PL52_9BACT|nr:helix-hairpin-helix domain-containing protein [Roseiconus lacunae]MDM4017233.1 helix-hairpin-helix domain-containing protein [Roseiconus lacunae]WRQ51189.1 helix-hairpin-helix domain-containing protein [Stieleria sp. HD01]
MNKRSDLPQPALLNPSVQRMLVRASLGGILLLAAISVAHSLRSRREVRSPAPLRIDLNQAGERELALLPQIGTKTARRIIADREQNGPFGSIQALTRVHGIGEKTVESLVQYISLPESTPLPPTSPSYP